MSILKKNIKKQQNPLPDSETKKSGKWTEEEDILLQQVVPLYNERHWRKISQHMKGRSAIQCLHRWTKILRPGLVKGPWSTEEDNKLMVWVQEKGPIKWAQCAILIPGRSGKQCRERWFNNLNPNVKKGDWNPEEDDLIFKLYVNYGSSWSKIAMHFKDRTENSIKNRFYSTIRKLYSDQKKLEKGKTVKKHLKKQVENEEMVLETVKNEEISKEDKSKEDKSKENNSKENNSKENNSKENNSKENNSKEISKENNSKENENKTKENNAIENKTKENSKNSNKNLINTLYDLLKTSNIEHAPHINNIYASGIYKKSRRYRRKPKKNTEIPVKPLQEESIKSITTRVSSNIKDEAYCSESESEDGNFENFLSSIENTINKELILREMDCLKDLSLEELQNKVFDFCNENPINLEANEDRTRTFELENILNQQIEKEIIDGSKNTDKILEKAIHDEIISKCDEQSFESDKKMFFLVQQLQTLENMLTKTRQELISLENSLQIPDKNCSLQGENNNLKEEDSFVNNFNFFNENLPNISEWNCKRKASLSLDDFFDFPIEGLKKQKRFNFMDEELVNDNFKEE